ncbi:MAG: GatB/YqeY domain-containing protein [Myxococcales bacterium]
MSLKQRIDDELKKAMKARDESALTAARMLKSAVGYKEIETGGELDDAGVVKVLQTLIKQRKDSAEQFRQGNRPELADKEEKEIVFLSQFLPQQLSADELERLVDEALREAGAAGMKDMGPAMKAVQAKVQGRADNKAVSELVRRKLSSQA